jgi:hypothetical protein
VVESACIAVGTGGPRLWSVLLVSREAGLERWNGRRRWSCHFEGFVRRSL